jgi:hypothetical protein
MDRAIPACHINAIEVTRQESGPEPNLLQVDPTLSASSDSEDLCQTDSAPMGGLLRRPASVCGLMRFLLWSAASWIKIHARNGSKASRCGTRITRGVNGSPRATPGRPDAVLNLQSGEYVEVKTFDEIRRKHAAAGFCAGARFG